MSKLFKLCPSCLGTGQVDDEKARTLGLKRPCPDCEQIRVVEVEAPKPVTSRNPGRCPSCGGQLPQLRCQFCCWP